MTLWLILVAISLAVVAAMLVPLVRTGKTAPDRAEFDLAVYKSQLAEVDLEAERGLVSADLADAARTEIQRRMLASAATPGNAQIYDDRRARMTAALVVAAIVPLGSLLLYAAVGSPALPDRPYADRLKHDPAVIAAAATDKLAAQLRADPSASGYMRLGNQYALDHNYVQAAQAFERAISLGGETSAAWSDLGETIVLGSSGAVVPEALRAFAHALTLNRFEPRARFYVGLAEAEIGHYRQAVAIWRDLEKDSMADAPWLPLLEQQIAAVSHQGGFDPKSVPPAPPSTDTLNAAASAMDKR